MDQKGASGSRSTRLSQGKVTHAHQAAAEIRRSNIIEDMAKICEADRQTSSFAQRTQGIERPSADNSGFVAVEYLILASAEPTPEERVEMIMLDFCSSPTYTEDEDEPSYESEPWFRFRKKRIKTYGRKRDTKGHMVVQHEEPSSSSALSVQRDPNTSLTSVACDFDAAASQRIHEVLLNLSQYLSVSATDSSPTPSVPSQIDLPTEAGRDPENPPNSVDHQVNLSDTNLEDECLNTEVMNLRDDLLENGFTFEASMCDNEPEGTLADTLFGDTRQAISTMHPQLGECKVWSDADSVLKKTEKMSLDVLKEQMQAEHPLDENTNLILKGIPMSEWQTPMELPEKSKELINHIPEEKVKLEPSSQKKHERSNDSNESKFRAVSNKESDIAKERGGAMVVDKSKENEHFLNDGDLLQEFLFNEWNPIQSFEGPSTSKDAIEVHKKEINSMKPDDEQQPEKKTPNKSQSSGHKIVGFRKTPYKFIEVSEEMKLKGEKFVAQVVSDLYQSTQKCHSVTEEYSANHSQVMKSTSKPIETLDVTNKEAKLEVGEINAKCSPLKKESIAEPEFSGFRTASNKAIVISEKMKMKTAEFMTEFQSAESNQQNGYEVNQPNDTKSIEISKEMPSKVSKLVIDIKMEEPHDSNESTFIGFRTASNKAIEITEAMERRGAMFLAQSKATDQQDAELTEELVFSEWQLSDLPDVDLTVAPVNVEKNNTVDMKTRTESELFGFRTASNKGIVISEKMKMKTAEFMAEFQSAESNQQNGNEVHQPNDTESIEISKEMRSNTSKLVVDIKMKEPYEPTNAQDCCDSNESTFMGFRTASNKAIEFTEAMERRGAMFLAQSKQPSDLPDVASTSNDLTVTPINVEKTNTVDTKAAFESEFFGFRTASNKGIVISESTKVKAAQFMSEFQAVGPSTDSTKPIGIPEESKSTSAQFVEEVVAEDSPSKAPICDVQSQGNTSAIEHFHRNSSVDRSAKKEHPRTPKRSQEIHSSLSQLAGISPLDQATKKSVIERRNILTLKRRRKITSSTATSAACASPAVERFAPMPAATSTPLAARNSNLPEDCTKDRQSVEDMSPICMQPRKSRRLGLSGRRY
ncbi:breast cancer type 2 susceptibility protein homolog isoform X2 [Drosophila santomea]|uniref:breast cancer type 2 susceptibility protein homolog isoform X2 n=1 Tax=Drosophila santomea TaxID=129105 RepID=UPI00195475CA|nr:breast cancer type 2 susceptibility protein homolog isoform X2 [Drosophila santomea]